MQTHADCWKQITILVGTVFALGTAVQADQGAASLQSKNTGMRIVKAAPMKTGRPLRSRAAVPVDPAAPSAARTFQDRRLVIPKTRNSPPSKRKAAAVAEEAAVLNRPVVSSIPAAAANFEGVGNVNGVLPPDTQGDIGWDPVTGKKYYVQWVNLAYQMWDVTNPAVPVPLLAGPAAGNSLWEGTGGLCESHNDGDPLTRFDSLSNRWVMSQFALGFPDDFHQCIAVSATADPSGEWYLYDFKTSAVAMNDYGKLGVWPDGYYMSFNQFDGATEAWRGAGVAVFERDRMLLGQAARMIYLDVGLVTPNYGGMLPADLDGPPPPVGTPSYFMEWDDSSWLGDAEDTLRIWEFKTDWATPANTTFGLNAGYDPNLTIPTANVDPEMCSGSRSCVKQPGTVQGLDPISDRLMYRLQYRNFGSYQTLVGNHTVDATGTDQAGIHWLELRNPGSGFAMHQEGVYAPDADSRWMGSAAMDTSGNIALGYSVASSTIYPSVRYTGRLAGDPAGTLPQGEGTVISGTGSQTHAAARWGDYSMLAVDPSDGCTFWYTQEYIQTTGTSNWQTRIGSFRFPSCTTAVTGSLSGTVTDTASTPLAGVTIAISGGYSAVTDASGHYSIPLASGIYDLTASKYAYIPSAVNGVAVSAPGTTTQDFTLSVSPVYTIGGVVRDAATAWPLYARIEIAGYPGGPVFSDPATGVFSVGLVSGSYSFAVTAMSGGYSVAALPVTVSADAARDINLAADLASCAAPGYQLGGFLESFETWPLPGWTLVNGVSGGLLWDTNIAYGGFGNFTGGTGQAATVNSDQYPGVPYNTELRSPQIDPSSLPNLSLRYKANYQDYSAYDTLDLDISNDSGAAWTNISSWTTSHGVLYGAGETVSVDLTNYVSAPFMLRWHYYSTEPVTESTPWDYYIQVDDVRVGTSCAPVSSGGLVIGAVRDANTGTVVSNATVRDAGLNTATMIDASADPATPARLYVIGQTAGPATLTATAPSYGAGTVSPTVVAGSTVWQDIDLSAGKLTVDPGALFFNLTKDAPSASLPLSLANSGGAAAAYQTFALTGTFTPPVPTGPFADNTRHVGPKNLEDRDARNLRVDLTPTGVTALAAGTVSASWPTGLAYAWGIGFDTDAHDLWLGNIAIGGGDDLDYRFTTSGTTAGDTIDTSPWAVEYAADLTYNPFTKSLWQVNVSGDNCIYELDPSTRTSTGSTICPAFGTSERGLAFDPVTNTYYSGSWTDGIVNHFAPDGTILDSKATGLGISGLAFNPATGHLFVMTNTNNVTDPLKFDIYILDTKASYSVLGGFNLRDGGAKAFADYAQAGLELDCSGNLWAVDQAAQKVYVAPSGETGVCDWQAGWLSITPSSGSVAAGGTLPLTASVDVSGIPEGIHTAYFKVANDAPYGPVIVPVTVTVNSRLTVTRTGTGSGTVIGTPGGINCGADCAVYYYPNSVVTLTAVPATFSSFAGWGGDPDCADGIVTMDTSKTCSAAFAITPLRTPGNYETIQAAYDAARDNGTIQAQEHVFEENVLFDRPVTVTIDGGYNADFTSASGMTTIEGRLEIRSGKAIVSRLNIRN